jgi:Caenorhabditis protein of unknown function, DUF268
MKASPSGWRKQAILEVVSSSKFLLFVFSVALIAGVSIQDAPLSSRTLGAPITSSKSIEERNTNPINGISAGHRSVIVQTEHHPSDVGMSPIFDAETTTDPWKAELFQRLDRIRTVCGLLCQLNTAEDIQKYTTEVPGSVLPMIRVEVDCPAILGMEEIDAADSSAPPIPDELKPYFTFNNVIEITNHKLRRNIALGVPEARIWTEEAINQAISEAKAGTLKGTYGVQATSSLRDDLADLPIRGKSIMVIGTQKPWIEAILLHFGAAKVTTLEYSNIVSEHPKLKTLEPHQFRERFLAGTLESFDGIVSHSSLEHSGLGRYGDALNPWGDILAVARAWCVTKEGGFLYLGLPTGNDNIMSNWHRTYGRIRWPLVAANWKPLPTKGDGKELTRDIWKAFNNGGYGYKFTKESL